MVLTQVEGQIRITWGAFPHTNLFLERAVCGGEIQTSWKSSLCETLLSLPCLETTDAWAV